MKPRVVVATLVVCTRVSMLPRWRSTANTRQLRKTEAPRRSRRVPVRGLSGYLWVDTGRRAIADWNMQAALTRRQALIGATAGLLAAHWPRLAGAQAAAGALTLTDLTSDLALASGAGANVVALASADGLLLVDGGAEAHAAALQGALAERWPSRPVRLAFNTN